MTASGKRNALGVVGGMGPMASAEFLKTIYEHSLGKCEQESPIVFLYSDPSFPDRTEALLEGSYDHLLEQLVQSLNRLRELAVTKVVICCITIHYLLPRLAPDIRSQIVSLLDVIFENVAQSRKKHLLLCTNGTRKLKLFQSHNLWGPLKNLLVLPDEDDQDKVHHGLIYPIKRNCDIDGLTPFLESLLLKYEVDSFISGCTEMHILAKRFLSSSKNAKGYCCVDPLTIIAKELAKENYGTREY
jgi:aspartate racemase